MNGSLYRIHFVIIYEWQDMHVCSWPKSFSWRKLQFSSMFLLNKLHSLFIMFLFVSVHQMDVLQSNIMAVVAWTVKEKKEWNIKYKVGNAGDMQKQCWQNIYSQQQCNRFQSFTPEVFLIKEEHDIKKEERKREIWESCFAHVWCAGVEVKQTLSS